MKNEEVTLQQHSLTALGFVSYGWNGSELLLLLFCKGPKLNSPTTPCSFVIFAFC